MKATITFNLPEDNEEYKLHMKAGAMHSALWEISQEIFRPARKHGYNDPELNKLIEDDKVTEAISLLEKKMYDILRENDIEL